MIINLIDRNPAKIILALASSPGRNFTRKELKEKSRMHNLPLDNALNFLTANKVIVKKKKIIYINLDNILVQQIIEEIKKFKAIPLAVQYLLIDFILESSKISGIESVFLFGSYSKLIFTEKSDVDIAVIFNEEKNIEVKKKKIFLISKKLSKKYKKEIQEHIFQKDFYKNKKDVFVKEILQQGIKLI